MVQTTSVETSAGDVRMSRSGTGGAAALIALHGIPGARSDLDCLSPSLSDQIDLICLDMPGFGDSDLGGVGSPEGWADTVVEVADGVGLDHFSLLAHSMGGGPAMLLSRRLPQRVERVIFLCSIGVSPHQIFRDTPPPGFRSLVERVSAPESRDGVVGMVRAMYADLGLEAPGDWRRIRRQLELCANTDFEALAQAASEITVPATIIHTRDDPYIEVELARELARVLPHAQLHELPEGGHYPQRSCPERVAGLVEAAVA